MLWIFIDCALCLALAWINLQANTCSHCSHFVWNHSLIRQNGVTPPTHRHLQCNGIAQYLRAYPAYACLLILFNRELRSIERHTQCIKKSCLFVIGCCKIATRYGERKYDILTLMPINWTVWSCSYINQVCLQSVLFIYSCYYKSW